MGELEVCSEGSKFIKALSECTMTTISSGVTVFEFDVAVDPKILGSNMIFVRTCYFPLFSLIRSRDRCVLVGNPGTSKSLTQFFYLAWILNPMLLDPLPFPPDYKGRTDAPKVVIRQAGDKMTIYDIEKRVAYRELPADPRILKHFDPAVTLYLYEPAETKNREPYYYDIECSTLVTVLPHTGRYKQFLRNGGVYVYMPIYERQELLDIGKHLLDQENFPEPFRKSDLYSPKNISDRFEEFGGIIRHVLPICLSLLDQVRCAQDWAVNRKDALTALISSSIEDDRVSDLLRQMHIRRLSDGSYDFRNFHTEIVNDDIVERLEALLNLEERIRVLRTYDDDDDDDITERYDSRYNLHMVPFSGLSIIHKGVLAELLTSGDGVRWEVRKSADSNKKVDDSNTDWIPYDTKLTEVERDNIPTFDAMIDKVLYYPRGTNHEAVDFYFKSKNKSGIDRLSAFQVTRQQDVNNSVRTPL